jgi:hypothetical protein
VEPMSVMSRGNGGRPSGFAWSWRSGSRPPVLVKPSLSAPASGASTTPPVAASTTRRGPSGAMRGMRRRQRTDAEGPSGNHDREVKAWLLTGSCVRTKSRQATRALWYFPPSTTFPLAGPRCQGGKCSESGKNPMSQFQATHSDELQSCSPDRYFE